MPVLPVRGAVSEMLRVRPVRGRALAKGWERLRDHRIDRAVHVPRAGLAALPPPPPAGLEPPPGRPSSHLGGPGLHCNGDGTRRGPL